MLYELPLSARLVGRLEHRLVQTARVQLSISNVDNLSHLPHQRQPSLRSPATRHSLPRPIVRLPIRHQPRQFVRRHWRSPFSCRHAHGLASPCPLQHSSPGPCSKTSMRAANLHALKRQHAAWRPVDLRRLALPVIGSTWLKIGPLGRLKKRRRRRLPPAIWVCSFPHSAPLRRSPSLAREKFR